MLVEIRIADIEIINIAREALVLIFCPPKAVLLFLYKLISIIRRHNMICNAFFILANLQ